MPYINRALSPSIHFSQSQQQRINEAINKIIQEDGGQPQPIKTHIRFPLGPIVLVIGLWLLTRREQPQQINPPTHVSGLSQDEGRTA
jgi:hypothetical protein